MAYTKEKNFQLLMDAIKMVEVHEEITLEHPANKIMLDAWKQKRDELYKRVYR